MYVVNAFSDHRERTATSGSDDSVSQREIGVLFHDTAEQAANQDVRRREEWCDICEGVASQRRSKAVLPAAKACIDRCFELDLSAYEVADADREFELEIDGHELVGFTNAVYRMPENGLLVIDYGSSRRKPRRSRQG